jgi:hypothetical protein
MPGKAPGFIPDKSDDHGEAHERHGAIGIVDFERERSEEKGDGEKEEALDGGLPCEDEDKDEEDGKERKAQEKLKASGVGLVEKGWRKQNET